MHIHTRSAGDTRDTTCLASTWHAGWGRPKFCHSEYSWGTPIPSLSPRLSILPWNVPSDPLWFKSQCRFWASAASPVKFTLVPPASQHFPLPTSLFNLCPVTPSLVHSQLRVTLTVLLMDTFPEPATSQKLNNYSQSKRKIHQQLKQLP